MTDHDDTSTLHSELRKMRRALDRQGADSDALRELVQASTRTITELKNALSLSHEQLRESRRHYLQLQGDNDSLKSRLAALEKDFDAAREKARVNLLGEQSRRKASEEKAAATIAALKKGHAEALKKEGAAAKASEDALQAEKAERQALATEALDKQTQLEKTLGERDNDIALLGEEITQLRAAAKAHEDTLQKEKAERETLAAKTEAHKAKHLQLLDQIAAAQTELAQMRSKAETAEQAAAEARDKHEQLGSTLSERDTDIALLGEEIARLQAENAKLSETRQAEISELGTLLEQKDQTVSTLAATQQRQAVIEALRRPHERLRSNLSNRNPVSSDRRHARAQIAEDIRLITASDLFDPDWYRATYPDIGEQDPVQHFAQNGAYELRNPSAAFDSLKYHIANPDVTESAIPALMHYLRHGKTDGRATHPVT